MLRMCKRDPRLKPAAAVSKSVRAAKTMSKYPNEDGKHRKTGIDAKWSDGC